MSSLDDPYLAIYYYLYILSINVYIDGLPSLVSTINWLYYICLLIFYPQTGQVDLYILNLERYK